MNFIKGKLTNTTKDVPVHFIYDYIHFVSKFCVNASSTTVRLLHTMVKIYYILVCLLTFCIPVASGEVTPVSDSSFFFTFSASFLAFRSALVCAFKLSFWALSSSLESLSISLDRSFLQPSSSASWKTRYQQIIDYRLRPFTLCTLSAWRNTPVINKHPVPKIHKHDIKFWLHSGFLMPQLCQSSLMFWKWLSKLIEIIVSWCTGERYDYA